MRRQCVESAASRRYAGDPHPKEGVAGKASNGGWPIDSHLLAGKILNFVVRVFTFAVRCFLNPCYGNRDVQAFKRPPHTDIM